MRFVNSLNRFRQHQCRGSQKQQPQKFRSRPSLEALEDRKLLSTATQLGSTLNITMDPGTSSAVRTLVMAVDSKDHTKMDVLENSFLLGQFPISTIKNVNVTVAGNDRVEVNDSNGLPFAPPPAGTVGVSLSGTGVNNSFVLFGSGTITASETYFAGGGGGAGLSLNLPLGASVAFGFGNAIGAVTDDLISTQFVVETRSQAISLAGPNGLTETLKGLSGGPGHGGDSLTFREKTAVLLQLESDGASAVLNDKASAIGLKEFDVDVFGKNDKVDIKTTPSDVNTHVEVAGQYTGVLVEGNLGPVGVNGDSTTIVALGTNNVDSSKSVTSGIKNNVFVEGAEALQLLDGGNVTTQENMSVTETTIFGTGMFGSNAVVVTYEDINLTDIETGRLANAYTVFHSNPSIPFVGALSINDDFSNAGITVRVSVDSNSALNLSMFNLNPAAGALFVSATGGKFNPTSPTTPDGTEVVSFTSGQNSTVGYEGFGSVTLL
jgi:hypothetical protein